MIILSVYCIIIALASLMGGWIPQKLVFSHLRIQMIISCVAGVMLGVAVLHLLPHSINVLPNFQWTLWSMLFGILFMFFMNRFFHFHHHDFSVEAKSENDQVGHADRVPTATAQEHGSHCDHEHHHHRKDTSWLGLSFGLAVHTLIDGIALAAAVKSETTTGLSFAGFSIFLAIVLHKPLDAISIVSLMKAQGLSEVWQTTASIAFSLVCPLGAMVFFFGLVSADQWHDLILGLTLAFSAGVFLCISLGDLLPEVHFHSHDRLKLSGALLFGILIAAAIEMLPGHDHRPKFTTPDDATSQTEQEESNGGQE